MTELKLLAAAQGQRIIALTFVPSMAAADLASVFDQLPVDVLILDEKLNIAYANANAGAMRWSGADPGTVLGCSALGVPPTNALPKDVYLRALAGGHYHEPALEISAPDGAVRLVEMDVPPWRDASGVVGLIVLADTVDRRGMLNSLCSANEHRLRALTENARDIITVLSADGRLQYVSGGVRNALGFSSEERLATSVFQHAHPGDVDKLREKYQRLISGDIQRFCLEYRVRHKDGAYRWLKTIYVSALDDPLIKGVVVNSRDITERKEAESRLAQREEVFRLAAAAVDDIIFDWDLTRGIVHRSRGVLEILGLESEELPSDVNAWTERIHPRDFPGYKKQIGLALIEGRGWTSTYRIRDARGRYRSMLERAPVQRNADGDPVCAIGCAVDVTEIKRLTDLPVETQHTAMMGGWEYSYCTRKLAWTDEMFRIYETSPEEFVVSWDSMLERCAADSRRRFREAFARAESGDGQMDLELELTTFKNRRIWARLTGHLEKLDGRPFRALGSLQNVQAQKLAQIALENSSGWLKLSMNMANMHAWRWDKIKDELTFAIAEGQAVHLPRAYRSLKDFLARVHPRDRGRIARGIDQAFESRGEVHGDFRLKMRDGSYRSYSAVARPLFDAAGEPRGLVGVTQDVTRRVEADAQLRRSEQLLRATTTNTADILILVDTDLRVRFINKPIAGKSIEEVLGEDILAMVPEHERAMVSGKLRRVLATGETATYEFEHPGDGAGPQQFESRAVLVRDHGVVASGISISVRNITERRRLEQEILEISRRERQSIGRDLHDGLGQELTGVALMLRGLAMRIERQAPEAVESVNEIVSLVNQSIESARSLARGLLPVRTDSGGLTFALSALAARSREMYGFAVNFRAEMRPECILNETIASHLYRIAQEAITNAARHGQASKVDIVLAVKRGCVLLEIADNGTGIGGSREPVTGMGLGIMRYRAGMIGAKFEIESNMPRGTIVRVTSEQPAGTSGIHSNPANYGGSELYER